MPLTDYTKQKLVQFIVGDEYLPNRSGRQLISLFNDFGCRDVYKNGLPINPRTGQNLSRKLYVENRLDEITETNVIGLLTRVINESEQKDIIIALINQIIAPDGYTISTNNGVYSILGGMIDKCPPIINMAHFQDIEKRILDVLDKAQVTIKIVIAWFTNETLRDKLLEKQRQGIEIQIAIYDDGINKNHGVDLAGLKTIRLKHGLRGGLMHNKFCIVDNQIVITGSYNWTNNAEFRNDENISIEIDPKQATEYSVEFRRLTTTL